MDIRTSISIWRIMRGLLVPAGFSSWLGVILIFSAVKVVPQGYMYTVEQFGRFTRTLSRRASLSSCRSWTGSVTS